MTGYCQFYRTPTDAERADYHIGAADTDIVFDCGKPAGRDEAGNLLYFFVPVEGGAVRAAVCAEHAAWLEQHHGTREPAT